MGKKTRLTRDPSITRGPDGEFRLVWTVAWDGRSFGYAHSKDLINWQDAQPIPALKDEPTARNTWAPEVFYDDATEQFYIVWSSTIPGKFSPANEGTSEDKYDHRVYCVTTKDFKTFTRMENPFIPFNRNAVLFPRRINGNYVMLSRPSDSGHTPFGDIFLSESPDLTYWGKHRHVMAKGCEWWEAVKIGGGAAPIETTEGWLLFYHGVSSTCNGFVYSVGGAILDIDSPSIVRYRCENFLLTPEEWYEERGFVPNVTFPCATIHDSESGKIALYYGAADSYVAVAFTKVDEIVEYIKKHSVLTKADTEVGLCM